MRHIKGEGFIYLLRKKGPSHGDLEKTSPIREEEIKAIVKKRGRAFTKKLSQLERRK